VRDASRDLGHLVGEGECLGVSHLERRRVIHLGGLFGNGPHDLGAPVARIHAPQSGHAVEDFATLGRPVMHARAFGEQARRLLELPVCREGHPVGIHPFGHVVTPMCGEIAQMRESRQPSEQ
jgi:hypothetical protein